MIDASSGPNPSSTSRASATSSLLRRTSRKLDRYPANGRRLLYSGIVVLSTVMLFYEYSIAGSVAPAIIKQYHMSFHFYVLVAAVSSLVGALASLLAGVADRWGRAGLVAYGLIATGLLTLFGLPNATDKWTFLVLFSMLGFVQGMVLVASSALVRDLSPQVQRSSAMAFWSLGPILGSLLATEVSSHTLEHLRPWQDQFTICGIAGLVVAAVTWLFLRELSPQLRGQTMASSRERDAVERRARYLDIDAATARPWRQMLHFDILGSAVGISAYLLIYFVAVGFFVIYFTTVFGLTQARANSIVNWFWVAEGIALVGAGVLSDRLHVRKPFLLLGGAGTIALTIVFASRASHPSTSYATLVVIVALLAIMIGMVSGPWLAAFTETVERRNPALVATGLALWGWTTRIAIAASSFVLPFVVTGATPLVDYGQHVQALSIKYASQVSTAEALSPPTLAVLARDPQNPTALAGAIAEVQRHFGIRGPEAITRLVALAKVPRADIAYLTAHGPAVKGALSASPAEWQRWFWVCVGGQVLFLPLILPLAGRWRPRSARKRGNHPPSWPLPPIETADKVSVPI